MHPYQHQINKLWEIIKLENRAKKNGFWLEALSFSYMHLEVELRMLLTTKSGKNNIPLAKETINRERYLMSLANLARENKFIDSKTWEKIKQFNDIRKKTIHKFIQDDMKYEELENTVNIAIDIVGDIQSRYIKLVWGEEEYLTPIGWKTKQKK